MSAAWYYHEDDGVRGPVDALVLRRLVELGRVTTATMVRNGTAGPWVAAESVTGLFASPEAGEPPEGPWALKKVARLGCRGVSWSMILLAGVCLFLPWVSGCGRDFSGLEVVWVCAFSPIHVPVSLYPVFLLVALIAGVCWVGKRQPLLLMTTACLAAAGSLVYGILVCVWTDSSFAPELNALNNVLSGFLYGYWMAIAAPLVAALFGWLEYRLREYDTS
jgi:hypothetical protein